MLGGLSCRDIPLEYWSLWEKWVSAQNEHKIASKEESGGDQIGKNIGDHAP